MPISRHSPIRKVLGATRDEICRTYKISNAEAFQRISHFITVNKEQWFSERPHIQYHDPFCRMAYLYVNVAVHAALVEEALRCSRVLADRVLASAMRGQSLNVCALGGGPGSELIGLIRFVERARSLKRPVAIDFALIDRTPEWDETWHGLKEGIDGEFMESYGSARAAWPAIVSRSFLPIDLTRPEKLADFATRFSATHLFIVSYLVSELEFDLAAFKLTIECLVERTRPGAVWLFLDRNQAWVKRAARTLTADCKMTVLDEHELRGEFEVDPAEYREWYLNIEPLPRSKFDAFMLVAESGRAVEVAGVG
jgi:hypothetical protein